MLLQINGKPLVSLELGQLYLLGQQSDGDKNESKYFIGLHEEQNISERHCVFETNHNEEAFVFDLFSFKGTKLNDKILPGMKKTLLKNGDVLKIGDSEIKYIHQGHEMSCDSSGFLEVQKNTSDIITSSPESTSQTEDRLKRSDDHCFLMPLRPSTSSRRSDSFAIPETQYCKPKNSQNASNLSIAESVPNKSDGKINFSFGNQDSFDDEDLCIPETQELVPRDGIPSSQKPHLPSDNQCKSQQTSILNEESGKQESGGSQFRICTQDYNEGFGEEEAAEGSHSQIIPIIRHTPIILNKTVDYTNPVGQTGLDQAEKELDSLKWPNSSDRKETTDFRSSCLTPDIFEFEVNGDKCDVQDNTNVFVEDEEDLLPTQRLIPVSEKVDVKSILNEIEKPCLEKEFEECLTSSDKENRCPTRVESVADMPATQILEARSLTAISPSNSTRSAIKVNTPQNYKESPHSLLNIDDDEEDDLLTQALLQPRSTSVDFFAPNSTLVVADKCTEKAPTIAVAAVDKNPFKEMPKVITSEDVFKKPVKDVSILKKTSSASSSAASENDVDLLMCTPQLIRDNLCLDRSEDLRNHILAAKNRNLFGDETEDEDDEQNNLVKFINVPKDSLDFDQLLPHLDGKAERSSETHDEEREAQKIYKFNIPFGKEQQHEKRLSATTCKPSSYSRDERHSARDKEREISERKRKAKAEKTLTKRQKKTMLENEEEKAEENVKRRAENEEEKEKPSEIDVGNRENRKRRVKKTENEQVAAGEMKGKQDKQDSKRKTVIISNKTEEIQTKGQVQVSVVLQNDEEASSTARLRKRPIPDKNEPQAGNRHLPTPAKRLTRSKSRFEESSSSSNIESKDDVDSISTQPVVRLKRNTITETKKSARTRTTEAPPPALPANIERKRLRTASSQESETPVSASIAVSITNVDQELLKDLTKSSKGLWNVAANPADSELLVMDKPLRTFKFLLAMARGIPIVTSEYLKKLNKSRTLKEVHLKDYLYADNEFERKYKFSLRKSLQAAKKRKMFKDYEFLMTANLSPMPQEIKAIIEVCGGYVHNRTPPQAKENQKLYLVTTKEDKKDWHKYRRLNKNITIVSTEAIMSSVMSQSAERMKSFILT